MKKQKLMQSKASLAIVELAPLIVYSAETGEFRWAPHTPRGGKIAGQPSNGGYLLIKHKGVRVCAHRLAMLKITGSLPPIVDHINGDRLDNRLCNLRAADYSINAQNRSRSNRNNRLGIPGVHRSTNGTTRPFVALIRVPGERAQKNLGSFATAEEAHEAYLKAKAELHPGWERKDFAP